MKRGNYIYKFNKYFLTYHGYQRAKERISDKIIKEIKTISHLMLEIKLNQFIRNAGTADIETNGDNIYFLIPNSKNIYILTKKDIIITVKKATPTNFFNSFV